MRSLFFKLKRKYRSDLRDGKAITVCAYDDDTRDIYELKLQFEPPYYRLKDTIELFEKKRTSAGQRIGFRYEAHFATLVFKLLKEQTEVTQFVNVVSKLIKFSLQAMMQNEKIFFKTKDLTRTVTRQYHKILHDFHLLTNPRILNLRQPPGCFNGFVV